MTLRGKIHPRWHATINRGPTYLHRTQPVDITDPTEGWQGQVEVSRYTRGVTVSEGTHTVQLTAREALGLLRYLQEHVPVLVDMAVEDAIAVEEETRRRQELQNIPLERTRFPWSRKKR